MLNQEILIENISKNIFKLKYFYTKVLKTLKNELQVTTNATHKTSLTKNKIKLNLTIKSLRARKNIHNIYLKFSEQHPPISLH